MLLVGVIYEPLMPQGEPAGEAAPLAGRGTEHRQELGRKAWANPGSALSRSCHIPDLPKMWLDTCSTGQPTHPGTGLAKHVGLVEGT